MPGKARSQSVSPKKSTKTARKLSSEERRQITIDLLDGDVSKGGPGTSLMSSSPIPKRTVNLDDLPANISQFIMDMADSKSTGAPMKKVPNADHRPYTIPTSPFPTVADANSAYYHPAGKQSIQPLKEGAGALTWFYPNLSSAEHTSLNDFFNLWTRKVPALFSEIQAKGGPEFHEICAQFQNFKRTLTMLSKVHRYDKYLIELCKKSADLLFKAEATLNAFSKLPGLGCQTVALLKSENVAWLIGTDEQKSAVSILDGSQKICSSEFYSSGQVLAHWHSKARKRQHGNDNRKKFEGKKDGKKDWSKSKKPKGAEFSGNN